MATPPGMPEGLGALFDEVARQGGRALLVGGCVRDALLGVRSKDVDIEVHRVPLDELLRLLRRFGRVDEVGRSFGVLKLRWRDEVLDVSVPRRDARVGMGHRGIRAEADPALGEREAARRRDLTINAIAYDPREGVWVDPWGGQADIVARRLRAVDPDTFAEDPLRALRVAQFAARFGFTPEPALVALCRSMPLHELPAERIRGEIEKLLLKGVDLRLGWSFAVDAGLFDQVLPGWARPCPAVLERVCAARPVDPARALALAYAAACTSEDVGDTLDRLRVFRQDGYDLRAQILFLVTHVARPYDDADLRAWADVGDLRLLAQLRDDPALLARAEALGVADGPLPALLQGRDLVARGVPPGRRMGDLLAEARRLQVLGRLTSRDDAEHWLDEQVKERTG